MKIRFVYFDCMDTLIQMDIHSVEIYPYWAFEKAEEFGLWDRYESFLDDWNSQRDRFLDEHGWLREETIEERLREIFCTRLARQGRQWNEGRIEEAAQSVLQNYWSRYTAASFVRPEVPETLQWLRGEQKVPLGVVSNFMVPGGIAELLARHRLDQYFQIVLVSCDVGWKKPAEVLLRAAIKSAGGRAEEILFIGDNPLADYHGPRLVGMQTLLYDPQGLQSEIEHRIGAFDELQRWFRGQQA